MAERLVLFDIDGTLIHGGSLWSECFMKAMGEIFSQVRFEKVSFGGKTDHQIYLEIAERSGITKAHAEEKAEEFKKYYLQLAQAEVERRAHEVQLLPGVSELVERLHDDRKVLLGLLTGNLLEGARAKLKAVKLWSFFKVGVFSDDHWDRYELPTLALKKVAQEFGLAFSKKQIVIIGDTIHDVRCGQSLGVRTIAVGTGWGSHPEAVEKENPDYFFKDLSRTDQVISAIHEEIET